MLTQFSIELAQSLVESTEQYPVDFDDLWYWCEYSNKANALRVLQREMAESIDFTQIIRIDENKIGDLRGRPTTKYYLTVDAAKMFAMMAGTSKGKEVRKYFLECERIAKEGQVPRFDIPKTYADALLLAANQAKAIEQLEFQIEKDAPLVAFSTKIAAAVNEISVGEMAKLLGMGRNTLFAKLRDRGVIQKNSAIPYQKYCEGEQAWFKVTETITNGGATGDIRTYATARVTGKGQIKIAELFGKETDGSGVVHIGKSA